MTDTSHRRDQYAYTREVLEALLPSVWDDEFLIMAARAERVGTTHNDPSHGNNLAAMVIDVGRAYWSLDKADHEVLWARFHHQLSLSAIAELAGLEDEQEAADDVDTAVNKMIEYLGGSR